MTSNAKGVRNTLLGPEESPSARVLHWAIVKEDDSDEEVLTVIVVAGPLQPPRFLLLTLSLLREDKATHRRKYRLVSSSLMFASSPISLFFALTMPKLGPKHPAGREEFNHGYPIRMGVNVVVLTSTCPDQSSPTIVLQ